MADDLAHRLCWADRLGECWSWILGMGVEWEHHCDHLCVSVPIAHVRSDANHVQILLVPRDWWQDSGAGRLLISESSYILERRRSSGLGDLGRAKGQ